MNLQYHHIKQKIKIKTFLFELANKFQNEFGEYPSYNQLIEVVNGLTDQADEQNVRLPFLQENIVLSDVGVKQITDILLSEEGPGILSKLLYKGVSTGISELLDKAGSKAVAELVDKAGSKAVASEVGAGVADKVTAKKLAAKNLSDKVDPRWNKDNWETITFGNAKQYGNAPVVDLSARQKLAQANPANIIPSTMTAAAQFVQGGPHIEAKPPTVMSAPSDASIKLSTEIKAQKSADQLSKELAQKSAPQTAEVLQANTTKTTDISNNPGDFTQTGSRQMDMGRVRNQKLTPEQIESRKQYEIDKKAKSETNKKDKLELTNREDLRQILNLKSASDLTPKDIETLMADSFARQAEKRSAAAEVVKAPAAEVVNTPEVVKAPEVVNAPEVVKAPVDVKTLVNNLLKLIINNGIDKKVEFNEKDKEEQKINLPIPPKPPVPTEKRIKKPVPPVVPPVVPPKTPYTPSSETSNGESDQDSVFSDKNAPTERYGATIARADRFYDQQNNLKFTDYVTNINESHSGTLNTRSAVQNRAKKQQYKVVVVQDGKKLEIFAKSIQGIRRAVFGKKSYRVYDGKGSDITNYFKRLMASKKST